LKLFKKGRTAVEVAILVAASPGDAENWYIDYWRLMRQYHPAPNPYIRRHSALTEKSRYLKENVLGCMIP
jgi:hypothetical protein